MNYVLGFLFRPDGHWLAVKKEHGPEFNLGKWNGIGGKVEKGEIPLGAMRREAHEETSLGGVCWEGFGQFGGPGWMVHLFRGRGADFSLPLVNDVGEVLMWQPPTFNESYAYNLRWLLPLAQSPVVLSARIAETGEMP
jgi:8-oxo-dGTP diphosphatase